MKRLFWVLFFLTGVFISDALAQHEYYTDCPDCKGKRYTATQCSSCRGRGGNERYTYRNCRACKGTRVLKEVSGYVDGRAVYRSRKCEYCNGTGREKSSVEWIRCSTCNGTGEKRQRCYRCSGTGTVKRVRYN